MKKLMLVPVSVMALLAVGAPANGFIFNKGGTDDPVIEQHRDRQQQIRDASQTILAKAQDDNGRDLTAAEAREVDDFAAEFETLEAAISRRERVNAMSTTLGAPRTRQTDPDPVPGTDPEPEPQNRGARPAMSSARAAAPRIAANGTWGYRSLGDFAMSVKNAAQIQKGGSGAIDERLRNVATTYGTEGVGADGGYGVPPDYRNTIMAKVFGQDSLVGRSDIIRSSSNSLVMPIDMTTPWDSSSGIQVYWTAEAGAITQSKPKLENITVKAEKLAALVPVTEELLEDSAALDSYLNKKVPEKLDFKISDAMIRGGGAGLPLGILNAPCLATQAAESGQTSGTIVAANVLKMQARLPASSQGGAVWLIHPDAIAQLPLMTIGQQPAYVAPGGLANNPYGSLLGRPVIPHQVCNTLGTLGDIMLCDWNQYLSLVKSGNGRDQSGIKQDVSIHLYFDQDLVAYKWTLRMGGQPWWSAATAQRSGSNTQSPFVTLASR